MTVNNTWLQIRRDLCLDDGQTNIAVTYKETVIPDTHAHTHTHTHTHTQTHIHIHTRTYARTHAHTRNHTHTPTHIYIYNVLLWLTIQKVLHYVKRCTLLYTRYIHCSVSFCKLITASSLPLTCIGRVYSSTYILSIQYITSSSYNYLSPEQGLSKSPTK